MVNLSYRVVPYSTVPVPYFRKMVQNSPVHLLFPKFDIKSTVLPHARTKVISENEYEAVPYSVYFKKCDWKFPKKHLTRGVR